MILKKFRLKKDLRLTCSSNENDHNKFGLIMTKIKSVVRGNSVFFFYKKRSAMGLDIFK